MKNYLLSILTSIAIFTSLGFISEKNDTNARYVPEKKWMIAPRFLKLQEGISKEEAREWLEKEYLPLYRSYPGFNCQVGEPWRSGGWGTTNNDLKEKADFVLIYFFDNKETAALYFPDDGSLFDAVADAMAKHLEIVDQVFFGKYFIRDKYQIEEYMMFASSK